MEECVVLYTLLTSSQYIQENFTIKMNQETMSNSIYWRSINQSSSSPHSSEDNIPDSSIPGDRNNIHLIDAHAINSLQLHADNPISRRQSN